MSTYETYPGADRSPADHGIFITTTNRDGTQESTLLGPYSAAQAVAELGKIAQVGTGFIDVSNSLVLQVSDRELIVVHETFFSTWTARAVVARHVKVPS